MTSRNIYFSFWTLCDFSETIGIPWYTYWASYILYYLRIICYPTHILIYWENSIFLKSCFYDSEFDAAWIEFMFLNYASAPSLSCKYLENIYLDISPSDKNTIVIKSYYGVSWMSLMFSKIMKNFHVPYVFTDNIHRNISNFFDRIQRKLIVQCTSIPKYHTIKYCYYN